MANSLYRADFIMQNLKMQCNVIDCAYRYKAKKLLFLGSTCIYPKNAPQPMGRTRCSPRRWNIPTRSMPSPR